MFAQSYEPFSAPVRRCRPTETHVIQPYSWQSYGLYTTGDRAGSWFAAPVRASNEYMAIDAVLRQVFPCGPVVTSLRPIEPMERPEKDRTRFRRDALSYARYARMREAA
jgi:hypothetical protein